MRLKLLAAIGAISGLGVWRVTAGYRHRLGPSPREHVARAIDEVLMLTDEPIKTRPEDDAEAEPEPYRYRRTRPRAAPPEMRAVS